jgi:adenine-specific DNA-methyltransferase
MTNLPEKLDLTSHNLPADKTAELLRLFPEIRTEGEKIDFDKLKLVLGQTVDAGRERYGMNWPGKADCFKTIQAPSTGTLLPAPEESVDFDTTENLIIEGDNLNVLKLLQKSYLGKVKMIYIDPPYNTGNDFIYPDNYAESLQTYLEYTGQVDDEGRKFGTNTDTDGRFHSRWMNMMYPRLYLARNLLRDDGVIFISIDDNEVDNLRKLCNEIFGDANFVSQLVWKKKYTGGKHARFYADLHEYIIVYAKNVESLTGMAISRTDEEKEKFEEEDEFVGERGRFYVRPLKSNLEERKTLIYPITMPDGNVVETQWLIGRDRFEKELEEKRIEFRQKRNGEWQVYKKYYELDGEGKVKPPSLIEKFPNTEAKKELKDLFNIIEGRDNVFYTVKPVNLLNFLLEPIIGPEDIVLDFFAGSGTTAQAVLDLNERDGGKRKFILIQLPEPTEREDFQTITEITKERVRRVIKKLNAEKAGQFQIGETQDRGFRVFKLAESNFLGWEASAPKDGASLAKQLELHIDHIREGRSSEDILYEILLKSGFPLTTPVENIEVEGKSVYSVAGGGMLICLEKELTLETVRAMAELKPQRVICLDLGFAGNDQLKANAVQIFKTKEIVFKTV